MIILDTNVISEVFRPHPEPRIVSWLEALTGDVAITAVTLAELLTGVRRLPDGNRKRILAERIDVAVEPYREDRSILAFDLDAAKQYAQILTVREAAGLPISMANAQIAAICRLHNATCATRNIADFSHTGINLIDPWNAV